ncbi:hypothetical protein [Anaerobiospirillum thomasii]|uniref:Antitoxin HicB n=1 Tax=Anaerobiospirillum thomasii TaxID=179995 RepID=A0A2X0WUB0_9GAMM|nr:hypothetical protein [Anaerobiospirillum thomasii]SPT70092.1 Antitoxin HicB [Anaerobiospirillum thomasii]
MNINDYLIYGFKFEQEDLGFSVLPGEELHYGATQGDSYDEAYDMAQWFVRDVADSRFRDMEFMPKALPLTEGMVAVNIGVDSALKIMLRNVMVETRTKQVKLAKLMNIKPQAVTNILTFDKGTKIETLYHAFAVMGKPLQIGC